MVKKKIIFFLCLLVLCLPGVWADGTILNAPLDKVPRQQLVVVNENIAYWVSGDISSRSSDVVVWKTADNGVSWSADINLTAGTAYENVIYGNYAVGFDYNSNVMVVAATKFNSPFGTDVFKCDLDDGCSDSDNWDRAFNFLQFPSQSVSAFGVDLNAGWFAVCGLTNLASNDNLYCSVGALDQNIETGDYNKSRILVWASGADLYSANNQFVLDSDGNLFYPVSAFDGQFSLLYSVFPYAATNVTKVSDYNGFNATDFLISNSDTFFLLSTANSAGVRTPAVRMCNFSDNNCLVAANWDLNLYPLGAKAFTYGGSLCVDSGDNVYFGYSNYTGSDGNVYGYQYYDSNGWSDNFLIKDYTSGLYPEVSCFVNDVNGILGFGTHIVTSDIGYYTFGGVTIEGAPQDINVVFVSADGNDFFNEGLFYSYGVDGNVTITFKVRSILDTRLLLDLNYSTSASVGSGVVLLDDYNLNSICEDLDFRDFTNCSWDFNIMNLDNNVLFFTAFITDGSYEDSNVSSYIVVDNSAPVMDYNVGSNAGFASGLSVLLDLNCYDNTSPGLSYIISVNDSNVVDANYLRGSDINYEQSLDNQVFDVVFYCFDQAGNWVSFVDSNRLYYKFFRLVDEESGQPIDVSLDDFNALRVYSPDKNLLFDFKAGGDSGAFFSSVGSDRLRFEVTYLTPDNTLVTLTRDITLDVLPVSDVNISICVPAYQAFFTHYVLSSSEKPVAIVNNYTGCYILADYTRYAYSDSLINYAYLIDMQYFLYQFVDGNKSVLALLDGSVQSTINLDVLQFKQRERSILITTDDVSVFKPAGYSNTFVIFYENLKADNVSVVFSVLQDNVELWSYSETDSPNEVTIYFDYSTLDFNADFGVLELVVTTTDTSGLTESFSYYFSSEGVSTLLNPIAAIIIACVVFVFGFTFVSYRLAFGWFGLIMAMIAVAILTLAEPVWYVIFFQALFLIIGVFIGLIFKEQGAVVT